MPTGRPALRWRIGLSLGLLLYAGLSVASGLDRMSAGNPGLERLVPGPLRAQAERSAAQMALAREQTGRMIDHARAAVAADPVDAGSLSLLGTGLLLRGDYPGAEQAFRVAARLGWRDTATQLYWYEAALQAGDVAAAADRLDALLRTHRDLPQSEALLQPLEATPAGRRALVARLAARPGWVEPYLSVAGKPAPVIERRAQVLAELGASGTVLGCAVVAPFVTAALADGARNPAERAWQTHCPGSRVAGGLADSGFEEFGTDTASPFGWQARPSGDVVIEPVTTAAGSRALQVGNGASVSRLVLVQSLALRPGRYRLSGKAAAGRYAASVGCRADPPVPSGVIGDIGRDGQVLDVPACRQMLLGLWLRPGSTPALLDEVRLEPAR